MDRFIGQLDYRKIQGQPIENYIGKGTSNMKTC